MGANPIPIKHYHIEDMIMRCGLEFGKHLISKPQMKCCIVGVGNHAQANLIPALLRLQTEGRIVIKYVCRKDVNKGDVGLKVLMINHLPIDVDFLVACGDPGLHKRVIDFSNETGIPCFVEKPHLIEDQYVNPHVMIGYNFNFMSVPFSSPDGPEFDGILCTTNGLYRSWSHLFESKIDKYAHALHSVIVHPLSVMITRYGSPLNVSIVDTSSGDDVEIRIYLEYAASKKFIDYSSKSLSFQLDITAEIETVSCKRFKADSYYYMFKHFVDSELRPTINTVAIGKHVLDIVQSVLKLVKSRL